MDLQTSYNRDRSFFSLKNYECGPLIYQTVNSTLYIVRHRKSQKLRVLKMIASSEAVRVSNELRFLRKFKGLPNILRIKTAAMEPGRTLIVTEFCPGGDLMTALLAHKKFLEC